MLYEGSTAQGSTAQGTTAHCTQGNQAYQGQGIWYPSIQCGRLHQINDTPSFEALLVSLDLEFRQTCRRLYERYAFVEGSRWDVFPRDGAFQLTTADGRVAQAKYATIGSWNPITHSWMWGWVFPKSWNIEGVSVVAAQRVRREGARMNWQTCLHPLLVLNAHHAWSLSHLAAYLMGWPLVYRAQVNQANFHYMAISQPRWVI